MRKIRRIRGIFVSVIVSFVTFTAIFRDVLTWILLVHAIKLHPSKSSITVFDNSSYAVTCESPNEVNIRWYKFRNGHRTPILTQRNSDVFVEQDAGKSQLLFPNVTAQHEGHYDCTDEKDTIGFDFKVMKHLKLLQKPDVYYALFGDNITLECDVDAQVPIAVSWQFNDAAIGQNLAGHYMKVNEGLIVTNFSEENVGNYTCIFYFTNDDVTDTASMKISLKQGKIPNIEAIYWNDTLHVLRSTTANIKCKVTAEPSAKIQWFRKGAELDLRKSNATVENKDNESILKIFFSTDAYLGNYTCFATNQFGNISKTFTLVEGSKPEPPLLSLGKSTDRSCSLYIYPNPPKQTLLTIKGYYKKQNLNNSDWGITDLQLEKENPYSLDKLEPSSFYNIKVEVCSDYEICTYSNDETCETAAPITGSANPVMQNIIAQFILLLPAFIIGFYS